jgi:hypothetical protein
MLTIASLLSILFMTFHLTDDIVRGMEPGTLSNLIAVPILVVWLYGTLVLAERRSGYVIILLGSSRWVELRSLVWTSLTGIIPHTRLSSSRHAKH